MSPLLKQQVVGEHVRRLRVQAGMSQRGLARLTGFSASFMSQVEHGQVSPSISSMEKIATALGVTLAKFFAVAADEEGALIVRVAERQALSSAWSRAEIARLSLSPSAAHLDAMLITLRPGGRSAKQPRGHAREEFALILQGEVTLTLGPEDHRLRTGDAVSILPGELRLWRNHTRSPARFVVVSAHVGERSSDSVQ